MPEDREKGLSMGDHKFVISGYYGFGNLGDECVLQAIISHLREASPGCEILVLSGDPDDTRRAYGVRSIHRYAVRGIARELETASLFISGGGSLFQDVTSFRSIWYYLGMVGLALSLGVPVMVYAQGIGPFRSRISQIVTRRFLNRCDVITVRDEQSRKALEALAINRPSIHVVADPVFGLDFRELQIRADWRPDRLGGRPGSKFRIGIAPREWNGSGRYRRAIAEAASRLIKDFDADCVLMPFHHAVDDKICHEISAEITGKSGKPAPVSQCRSPEEVMAKIQELDLLIGMRLHSLIMAANSGTPFIAISYDPKIEALTAELGCGKPLKVDDVSSEQIYDAAAAVLNQRGKEPGGAPGSAEPENGRFPLANVCFPREDVVLALREKSRKSAVLAVETARKRKPGTVYILGFPVDSIDMREATERAGEMARRDAVSHVVTMNAEICILARGDQELARIIRAADMVTADGAGVVWAARLSGWPVPERVAGYDLMLSIMHALPQWGMGVYLLGSAPEVVESAKKRLEENIPGLRVLGAHHGYFKGDAEEDVLCSMWNSGARVFFVAMGAPKQEKWIDKMRSAGKLPPGLYIGVGGAFDVVAGIKKRAPLWIQRAGLEWLYRVLSEPARIRRVWNLPRFMWAVMMHEALRLCLGLRLRRDKSTGEARR